MFTEYKYVMDLRTVKKCYLEPFQAAFPGPLPKQVFSDWQSMLVVHEQLLQAMESALPQLQNLDDDSNGLDVNASSSSSMPPRGDSTDLDGIVVKLDTMKQLDGSAKNKGTGEAARLSEEEYRDWRLGKLEGTASRLSKASVRPRACALVLLQVGVVHSGFDPEILWCLVFFC